MLEMKLKEEVKDIDDSGDVKKWAEVWPYTISESTHLPHRHHQCKFSFM